MGGAGPQGREGREGREGRQLSGRHHRVAKGVLLAIEAKNQHLAPGHPQHLWHNRILSP
jgi:hypothetical protein